MKLFELFATLALDPSEFEDGITKSESKWNTFGEKLESGLSKVGGLFNSFLSSGGIERMFYGIRNLADETSAAGDRIDKQSQALGMSRKAYQEWDYILGQSGASIDSLGVSMKTLNSAVLSDSDETREVFKQLGLSMEELNGLTQESQFEKVIRAFQQMPAGAEKSALAVKLFGRNGQDLLPLLNSSADSIDEMRQRAEELGLIMSDDAIDAAVAYNDALDDMDKTFKAVKYTVGAEFMPVMANMFRNVASYAGGLLNAYKEEGFTGVFKKIGSDIGGALGNIQWPKWDDIKGTAQSWWDETIKPGLASIMTAIFGVEPEDAQKALDAIKGLWDTIENGIESLFKATFELLTGDPADAFNAINDWWGKDVWPKIQDFFKAHFEVELPDWNTITTAVSNAVGTIVEFFNIPLPEAFEKAVNWLVSTWESIAGWIKDAKTAINNFFDVTIPENISRVINDIAGAWSSVASAISSAADNLRDWLGVTDAIKDAGGASAVHTSESGRQHGGGSGRGFSTGLDYVPYNEFPARLHEGEAVLTKSEATEWRRGESGAAVDLSGLGEIVEAAIARGMQGFGFFVDGQRLADATTEPISRNIADVAWAGRYAR